MKSPFPYFGGKSRVASLVWERFGDTPNYIEPFFGSGAVLLARPHAPKTETVNDACGFVANFFRALQADPEAVAFWCDYPVSELDLHARHTWLNAWGRENVERLRSDPAFYDAQAAGWWVWGKSAWIGSGWCQGAESEKIPHLGNAGRGPHRPALSESRQMPELGSSRGGLRAMNPTGESRRLPDSSRAGGGIHQAAHWKGDGLYAYFCALADRLRRVRVCCGDWSRLTGETVTWRHGTTGVFLDPPYDLTGRAEVYSVESDVSAAVREWAIASGENPLMRICVAGYESDTYTFPDSWECVAWKAAGGYGSQGDGETQGKKNCRRERLWFSPHCLRMNLFAEKDGA